MDDFDLFVENYRNELLSEYIGLDGKDKDHSEKVHDRHTNEELDRRRNAFRQSMEDIATELSLLGQQKQSLEQRLGNLEKALHQELHSGTDVTQAPGPGGSAGSSGGLIEPNSEPADESVRDFFYHAFCPDETALNKYAAMGYTSCDGGKTYEEIEGADLCNSCGETTLICPHKVGNKRDLLLPQGCTHLRISRPQAHVIMLAAKLPHSMKEQVIRSVTELSSPHPTKPTNGHTLVQDLRDHESLSLQEVDSQKGQWMESIQGFDVSRLKAHFEKHLLYRREEPRGMSLGLCRSFLEQLIAALLCEEERGMKIRCGESVQQVLSRLLHEHYLLEDVSSFGLQDVLAAVWKYSPACREIAVLGRVLNGELDPSVLRYIVLMADLLNSVSLLAVLEFKVFVAQVYPFLQGDDLENIILGYSSFSENRISRHLVMEYLLKLILQNSEPLFLENEDTLKLYSKTQAGHLISEELSAAIEDLAPFSSEPLRKSLVQQSKASLRKATIPTRHAAQITSYLMVLQQSRVQKEHLRKALETERSRQEPSKEVEGVEASKVVGDLIPISKVRVMAKVLLRTTKIRAMP
ncbi:uncharacterized protein [Ambystoma mexicanum]|uniref:uncharacterized protein n=1 Tax=Ambystoma mexicanum TaxID=8296 RepID=UPI0037E92CA4